MMQHSRRSFLRLGGVATTVAMLPVLGGAAAEPSTTGKASIPFDLGMASYTFYSFTQDQAIEMTRRVGLKNITLKDKHLPYASTEQEIKTVLDKLKAAGLTLSSCGVVYMTSEAEVTNVFRYAGWAGIRMMVGCPDAPLLPFVEKVVKETNIALAIHNHGPNDQRFPSPESAYKLIEKMDKRMGLCIDVGHTQRLGLDPAAETERFFDRVLDIHIKDVTSASVRGSTVEIGRGVVDISKLLKTLVRLKYAGTLHFEHEKDPKDPLAGVAESIGYVKGVLAAL
jgi:inosose dehydratase